MAIEVSIAPFINVPFYLTGAFYEPRQTHYHKGVDLSTGTDGKIYAIDNGLVIESGYGGGYYGYLITWNQQTNKGTLYGDLRSAPSIQVGSNISIGDFIGIEGPVGSRHVHIERKTQTSTYWDYNQSIDEYDNPCDYMQGLVNVVSYTTQYIYNGTPTPPTPPTPSIESRKNFPWFLIARKLRK